MNDKNDTPSWWGYYHQYKILTDKLINEDRALLDGVVSLPFLYCLSHTLELGFKASIIDFTGNLPLQARNHKLGDLFSKFKDSLLCTLEKKQVAEYPKLRIISAVDELEELIKSYEKLNPIHQSLKYPVSSDNRTLFNLNEGVDIKGVEIDKVISLYQKSKNLITWSTAVFCDQYIIDDIIDDLPEEYI